MLDQALHDTIPNTLQNAVFEDRFRLMSTRQSHNQLQSRLDVLYRDQIEIHAREQR